VEVVMNRLFKKSFVLELLLMFVLSLAAYAETTVKAEVFAELEGSLHGIVMDEQGNMYVIKSGFSVLKITQDGKASQFAVVEELGTPETANLYIFDLIFGPEAFPGNYGACGIVFDDKGNMFVSSGSQIFRYTPDLKKSVFIDGEKETGKGIENIIGMRFDAGYQNLYFCENNNGQLIRCTLKKDGTRGELTAVFRDAEYCPEYVEIRGDTIVIKGPEYESFYLLSKHGKEKILMETGEKKNPYIDMLRFGKTAQNSDFLYGPSNRFGKIFRINIAGFIR
jgi:hypothetical protein